MDVRARPIVQTSLGPHYQGAAYPHACPQHAPSLEASFRKRMAVKPLERDAQLFRSFKRFVRRYVDKNFLPLEADVDLTFKTWIESTVYPRSKKDQMARVRKMVDLAVTWEDRKWVQVDAFGKEESYATWKHQRSIYARKDPFKVIVGPLFKKIEDVLYKDPAFVKHVPVYERAKYIQERLYFPAATYLATDYTAYESHFTSEFMRAVEFQLYRKMAQNCPEAKKVLEYYEKTVTATNSIFFKTLKAFLPAGRMSGEMTTSLGNGFTNYMIYRFVCKQLGLKYSDCPCVIEGDDCLARIFLKPGMNLGTLQDIYSRLGMNVKIELHSDLCTASFCGLVFDRYDLINVVDPIKVILNMGWIGGKYKHASDKTLRELLKGKAMSTMCLAQGCPVIQSFCQYLLRETSGSHYRIDDYWLKHQILTPQGLARMKPKTIPMTTRLVMEAKFRVTVEDQFRMEKFFDGLRGLQPFRDLIFDSYINDDCRLYSTHYVMTEQGPHVALALPDQKAILEPNIDYDT